MLSPSPSLQAQTGSTVIFLTSGNSWTVPTDWNNADNSIEVIGGGGGGGGASNGQGGGGGGGAYSKVSDVTLTPGAVVTYAVGAGGVGGGNPGQTGGDTFFCNSNTNCASIAGSAVLVGAKGGVGGTRGNPGSGGLGGAAASGIGSVKYSGGDGANAVSGVYGGGGGGAAGPGGVGENGSTSNGGDGGNSIGGAGGTGGNPPNPGGAGTEFDGTHGSGGGGGGLTASANVVGGAGGSYGGGGGGARYSGTVSGGNGAQGIIVITYRLPPEFGEHYEIALTKDVRVTGDASVGTTLSKGAGTFVIDHPLDPKNMLLYHSFVESPDVKNIYDGIVRLDKNGEATVWLPKYFTALNDEYRYQATPLDAPMPHLHLNSGVRRSIFSFTHKPYIVIAGGVPYGEVSWQVTGIRKDSYIRDNPVRVEVEKGPGELKLKGECVFPVACEASLRSE